MSHACVNVFCSHACLIVTVWANTMQVFRNLW
jgi:hypothetical protein